MNYQQAKQINYYGIMIWIILFITIIPFSIITKHPIILLAFIYVISILYINILFIGKDNIPIKDEPDFNYQTAFKINDKALAVSTATFAVALAIKEVFKLKFYKELLIFMVYTLIFGAGAIIPVYFISNHKKEDVVYLKNEWLTRIRNISLTYSVGFMMCTFLVILNKIFQMYY